MSQLIAVTGKGGTGKTTLSACLIRLLLENGARPVLAVDADPNSTLAPLVGLDTGMTISQARQEVLATKTETTAIPKERILDLKLEECIQESSGFDLLTMGHPEGPSCYCYVNSLLRGALTRLRSNYRVTLVDNEAGMEHLSRMNTDTIDCLLTVAEPTLLSARAVLRILELSEHLSVQVRRRVLAWNKVPPEGVPAEVRALVSNASFDGEVFLPHDPVVARFSALEENVLAAPGLPDAFPELLKVCLPGIAVPV